MFFRFVLAFLCIITHKCPSYPTLLELWNLEALATPWPLGQRQGVISVFNVTNLKKVPFQTRKR